MLGRYFLGYSRVGRDYPSSLVVELTATVPVSRERVPLRIDPRLARDENAHEETDKARSLRTKHGLLGCRGKCVLRENRSDCCLRRKTRRYRPRASAMPARQRSGPCFVRSDGAGGFGLGF